MLRKFNIEGSERFRNRVNSFLLTREYVSTNAELDKNLLPFSKIRLYFENV